MSGPERPVRDQRGSVVAAALGVKPHTLQSYAARGLIPSARQPPRYRNYLYNLDEVRRTLPVATVKRRAQKIGQERRDKAAQPASRFTVMRVYVVTCADCETVATLRNSRELRSYKESHESTYHKGEEDAKGIT